MFRYLLNRLLWLLPTVWFITSVVFILIKLIPGEAAFPQEEDLAVNSASRTAIYQQYLERTGQHLPLFYFRIRSMAEPDSAWKVYPPQEQVFLRKMALEYGNWPFISAYYARLQNLRRLSRHVAPPNLRKSYEQQLAILFTSTDAITIQQAFTAMEQMLAPASGKAVIAEAIEAARKRFLVLQQSQNPYAGYIPAISWHGRHNQYHQWVIKALTGDLGISLRDARPVHLILAEAIENTLLLSICSVICIFLVAIALSIWIIHPDYQWLHKPVLYVLYLIDIIPVFLLAFLLIILLASNEYVPLFPVYGLGEVPADASWLQGLSIRMHHMIIPITCLTLSNIPYITSQLYTAMREITHTDFIQTARAKGVKEGVIVRKHVFKNSLLPLITLFSAFIPALLGGAVVVEVIFAIPGMGQLLIDSILARDYPVILGIVLAMAFAKIISHIVADILYYLADPRIKFS